MYHKNRYYYFLKMFIPRATQIQLRRMLVRRKMRLHQDIWPIDPQSATPPEGWQGWPEQKSFALVITHDVESKKGLDNCRALMDLEEKYGIRSSFNFVAGDYDVPQDLLDEMHRRGFEVGIHGFHHNGNLFRSKKVFQEHAYKINEAIERWGASGFRAPSMYHNLDWLHELNIRYDASTFDTDPFEPQPDAAKTIFPFHVTAEGKQGYIELPYTLPQDFLLFILMQEKDTRIWENKLRWIVDQGGIALFITHPDYIRFNGGPLNAEQYPAKYYENFLRHIKATYEGQYWHALPRDMAAFWKENAMGTIMRSTNAQRKSGKKVWIDLDNTPHIPFFKPIIDELNKRGHECVLTARDAYQVVDLADRFGLKYDRIGRHYGRHKVMKVLGTIIRSLELIPWIRKNKPDVAVSHGSRTQLVASHISGIPTLMLIDYEFAQGLVVINPTHVMVPNVIPTTAVKMPKGKVTQYPGIKEDVYVVSYTPNPSIIDELKIDKSKIIVTIRPPATEAHYFCEASEVLFEASMTHLLKMEDTQLVLLPRNKNQEAFVRTTWPDALPTGKIIIPEHAVNGLDLMWYSDLVISGGGTMNREATALGVPVYSIFRGTIGAVDHFLSQQGRLILLEKPTDLQSKLKVVRRNKDHALEQRDRSALLAIVDKIEQILEKGN